MLTENDWARIEQDALTAIRCDWPVSQLQGMARSAHPTPVSGDSITREKKVLRRFKK